VSALIPTIGLEVHCQLQTQTKMFCGCPVTHGATPNSAVCPVCLGHPGTLPVLNDQAVVLGVRSGVALSCEIDPHSVFSRKHYFYPDLPKGYQISQFDRPLCRGGFVHVEVDGERTRYELERIHLEEDAGKLVHDGDRSLVDWNRGGTPLIEIVGRPDIHSATAAAAWFRMMHRVMTEAGITSGDLQKGHFRCDANVSMAEAGQPLGTRVELKNINSFRFLKKAIDHEIKRQTQLLASGRSVQQSTRSWTGSASVSLREKEDASDYRYFPEPDLGPIHITEMDLDAAKATLPAVPMDLWLLDGARSRLKTFQERHGLDEPDAVALLAAPDSCAVFEAAVQKGGDSRRLGHWIRGPVARWRNESEGVQLNLTGDHLIELDRLVEKGELTRSVARELIAELCAKGGDVSQIVESRGLARVDDAEQVWQVAQSVVAEHPQAAERFRAGDPRVMGFFMGQAMRVFGGKVDAQQMQKALQRALSNDDGGG